MGMEILVGGMNEIERRPFPPDILLDLVLSDLAPELCDSPAQRERTYEVLDFMERRHVPSRAFREAMAECRAELLRQQPLLRVARSSLVGAKPQEIMRQRETFLRAFKSDYGVSLPIAPIPRAA